MLLNSLPIQSTGGGGLPDNVVELRTEGFSDNLHVYLVVSPSLDVSDLLSKSYSAVVVVTCSNFHGDESGTVYFPDGVRNYKMAQADIFIGFSSYRVAVHENATQFNMSFRSNQSYPDGFCGAVSLGINKR